MLKERPQEYDTLIYLRGTEGDGGMIVMKFEGTLVGSSERILNVARIVRAYHRRKLVIVVSAMAGVTDALLANRWFPSLPPFSLPYIYRVHTDVVHGVAWSPDGKRIASGSRDKTVQVWDAANGGNVYIYRGHSDRVESVAWSPSGKYLASANDGSTGCATRARKLSKQGEEAAGANNTLLTIESLSSIPIGSGPFK
jgi:WD40 repeat protein